MENRPLSMKRPWGREDCFARTDTYCGKLLTMQAGTKGGLQSHAKHETHYLLEGTLFLTIAEGGRLHRQRMTAGDSWHTPAGMIHQEEAATDCRVLEVSEPMLNDRTRHEATYGQPVSGLPSTPPGERAEKLEAYARALEVRAHECRKMAVMLERKGA